MTNLNTLVELILLNLFFFSCGLCVIIATPAGNTSANDINIEELVLELEQHRMQGVQPCIEALNVFFNILYS